MVKKDEVSAAMALLAKMNAELPYPVSAESMAAIEEALNKQARSAQQEPVAVTYKEVADTMNALWGGTLKQVQIAMELANKKLYTTPPAAQPAPVQENAMIYKTFEQWKSGNVLEHGVPRTEHYSEDQFDLVEMGWKYGYDAGRAVEQALDKKAENARELGLDYEPVLKDNSNYRYDPPVAEPVAYLCENAVGHKYFRWKKPSSTYKPIALYTAAPEKGGTA
jgi:hypothetical protein